MTKGTGDTSAADAAAAAAKRGAKPAIPATGKVDLQKQLLIATAR